MKKLFSLFILSLVLVFSGVSCTRIDSANQGIKVNLYGDNRGVDNVSLVSGMVWFNPFTTSIYEYEGFIQTIDYPAFTINAKDGSEFTVDPSLQIQILEGHGPTVFKKYRKPLKEIIETSIFMTVKDAYRIQLNSYSTDDIVSKRDTVERRAENQIRQALLSEGFSLGQVTSGLKYPETIVAAVNAKNKAVQEAMKVENELKITEAEAKKILVSAQAEKEANMLRQQSLTPLLIQQQAIEKWDGKLPVYGAIPTFFKNVQ